MHTKFTSTLFAMDICDMHTKPMSASFTMGCAHEACEYIIYHGLYVHVSMSFNTDYMHMGTSFTRAAMSTWAHLYHGWNMHMKLPGHVTSIQLDISVQSHMSTNNLPQLGEVASLTKRRQSLQVFTLLLIIPFSRPVRTKRGQSLQVVTLPVIS